MVFIALRLGKPIYEIWFEPSRAPARGETGAVDGPVCRPASAPPVLADPVPAVEEDVQ
jgi:hypothetical protein